MKRQISIITLSFIFNLISFTILAQTPCTIQPYGFGSQGFDLCADVEITNDAMYICGTFSATMDLGNGFILETSGGTDMFIAKLNLQGGALWAIKAGGPDDDRVQQLTMDQDGNLLIIGEYAGACSFGNQTLNSLGSKDIFISKISSSGAFIWAVTGGGPGLENGRTILAIGTDIYAAGFFSSTAGFGGNSFTSSGGLDIVLLKYNSNGSLIWAKQCIGTGSDDPRDFTRDTNGNLYLTGYFSESISFPGLLQTAYSSGGRDVFVTKINPVGNCEKLYTFGSDLDDTGEAIEVDSLNNVYITGFYSDNFIFNNMPATHSGGMDAFVVKFNSNFQELWIATGNGSGDEYPSSICIIDQNNIVISGYITSQAFFEGIPVQWFGGADCFNATYTSTGALINAESMGSPGNDYSQNSRFYDSKWCFVGRYEQLIQIGSQSLSSTGSADLLIVLEEFANSTTDFTSTINNLSVAFATNAPFPDSVQWDFGDGSYSNEFNPQHTYAVAASYQVTLTGYFPCNSDTAIHTVQLCEPPVSSFIYEPSYLLIHYDNTGTIADSIRWFFGDGTTSTQNNPDHLFASAGNYNSVLVAYNSCTTDTSQLAFYVCDSMTSSFTYSSNGNLVAFTLTSYNYYDVYWNFGDGNTSTELNPVHEYATGGSYTVSLYSINPCDSLIATDTVVVCELPEPLFTYEYVGDMTFAFTNQSTNFTSCLWYFGDGDSSTLINPSHTYDSCLAYQVTLILTNECGSESSQDSLSLITGLFKITSDPYIVFLSNYSTNLEIYAREPGESLDVQLYNLTGDLIYHTRFTNMVTVQTSTWLAGIYILRVSTANGARYVKKINVVH